MDNGEYKKYKPEISWLNAIKASTEETPLKLEDLTLLEWGVVWVFSLLAFYAVFRILRKTFFRPPKDR